MWTDNQMMQRQRTAGDKNPERNTFQADDDARVPDSVGSQLTRWAPAFTGVLCLLPLLLLWTKFRQLYWFHDDWDLVSDMERYGIAGSMFKPFAENVVPAFRILWAAAVHLVNGSYLGMIMLLWGTHLAILWVTAAVLRRCGFNWQSQSVVVLTLGLAWSNVETLGWATQWSSLLATFFFSLSWLFLLRAQFDPQARWAGACAVLCAVLSALSFSRGVVTGALLAFYALASDRNRHRKLTVALGSVTGAMLLVYYVFLSGYGNLQHVNAGSVYGMISYALHYLLLNPLYHFIPMPHKAVDLRALIVAGVLKIVIITAGSALANDRQRKLLWTLLLFDVGTGSLLAVGRYKLGLDTSTSYRYQHVSLLCFAPFLAVVAVKAFDLIKSSRQRRVIGSVAFTCWVLVLGWPWRRHVDRWVLYRGPNLKAELAATAIDQRFGLSQETAGRAQELIRIYGLH
jgi:hypothetical protein